MVKGPVSPGRKMLTEISSSALTVRAISSLTARPPLVRGERGLIAEGHDAIGAGERSRARAVEGDVHRADLQITATKRLESRMRIPVTAQAEADVFPDRLPVERVRRVGRARAPRRDPGARFIAP
jgi:hypothetical protein